MTSPRVYLIATRVFDEGALVGACATLDKALVPVLVQNHPLYRQCDVEEQEVIDNRLKDLLNSDKLTHGTGYNLASLLDGVDELLFYTLALES